MARNIHEQTRLASNDLIPFDFKKEKGIRHKDIKAFGTVAQLYNHYILVRATNEHSLPFIGDMSYKPKPIDCKPKTSDLNTIFHGTQICCAGLVVDPTLLPNSFNADKQSKAMDCWKKFILGASNKEVETRVFRRKGGGFYAVDTYKLSPYYGCLMLSTSNPPNGFRLDLLEWQGHRKTLNLCRLHGDYDLYGLIDVNKVLQGIKEGRIAEKQVLSEKVFGETNYYSPNWKKIQNVLNNCIGKDMIQHGSQDTFCHTNDKIYVFTPLNHAYVMNANKESCGERGIRMVYELIFKEEPISNRA